MSKIIANTFRHTGASSDAITLDSSGNVTFNGTVTGDNNTVYDDTNLRKDLATLALQTAVDTNRKAYNLNNSFIDQFEDATGIGSTSNSQRNDNEYVSSILRTPTAFNFKNTGTHDKPQLLGGTDKQTQLQSGASSSWSNDSVYINQGYSYKSFAWPDFLFDLKHDWIHYAAGTSDTSGNFGTVGNQAMVVLIMDNTTYPPGKAPTDASGNSIFKANGQTTSTSISPYDLTADNFDDHVFASSTIVNELNIANMSTAQTAGGQSGGYSDTLNYSTYGSATKSGVLARMKWTSTNDGHCGGIYVSYDQSEATLEMSFLHTGNTRHSDANRMIWTNCPADGRVFVCHGIDNTSGWSGQITSLNRGANAESNGTISVDTVNATGTLIGSANTASSSRTKVSGVFLYKNETGTATIGTDLKIYFTCNGGTNWTEAASYTAGSDFSTGIKTIYLGETTCTAGTDIRYKAEWANQAAGSKVTQLQGIGVNY